MPPDRAPFALQFGAGGIGRGFLGQLYCEAGLPIVFVDTDARLVDALNRAGRYTVHLVGDGGRDYEVTGVRALAATDAEAVAEAVSTCAVAGTAVGAAALPAIGRPLAAGIARRAGSLTVLVCENAPEAASILAESVRANSTAEVRPTVGTRLTCAPVVVARMVPDRTADDLAADPLAVRTEAYHRLLVGADGGVPVMPSIPGVEFVSPFERWYAQKLYSHNCAHTALGILGRDAGCTFGWQALAIPRLRTHVEAVMGETGAAIVRRYGFSREEQTAYEADLLNRFGNRELGDTCDRMARDAARKLAPRDRLIGSAWLCEETNVDWPVLAGIIAREIRALAAEAPSAWDLSKGIAPVLAGVCGLAATDPPYARLEHAWHRLVEDPS